MEKMFCRGNDVQGKGQDQDTEDEGGLMRVHIRSQEDKGSEGGH